MGNDNYYYLYYSITYFHFSLDVSKSLVGINTNVNTNKKLMYNISHSLFVLLPFTPAFIIQWILFLSRIQWCYIYIYLWGRFPVEPLIVHVFMRARMRNYIVHKMFVGKGQWTRMNPPDHCLSAH